LAAPASGGRSGQRASMTCSRCSRCLGARASSFTSSDARRCCHARGGTRCPSTETSNPPRTRISTRVTHKGCSPQCPRARMRAPRSATAQHAIACQRPQPAHEARRRQPQIAADGRHERVDEDQRGHVDAQSVGDRRQQQAGTAVANEHHGSRGLCGGGTHGLRYVTPPRRACVPAKGTVRLRITTRSLPSAIAEARAARRRRSPAVGGAGEFPSARYEAPGGRAQRMPLGDVLKIFVVVVALSCAVISLLAPRADRC
jgi:hypothetical protein